MKIHCLKTWPEPFEEVLHGRKFHEVRRADRNFEFGDTVMLDEWDPKPLNDNGLGPESKGYTGRTLRFRIGHITQPGTWGLAPGTFCVFTLLPWSPR